MVGPLKTPPGARANTPALPAAPNPAAPMGDPRMARREAAGFTVGPGVTLSEASITLLRLFVKLDWKPRVSTIGAAPGIVEPGKLAVIVKMEFPFTFV